MRFSASQSPKAFSLRRRGFSTSSKPGVLHELKTNFEGSVIDGRSDPDLVKAYTEDWTKQFKPEGTMVLVPKSINEVSKMLKFCDDYGGKIVSQGGNTGLVGGTVTSSDNEVILSLKRMNRIIDFDDQEGAIVCESGAVLDSLNEFLQG